MKLFALAFAASLLMTALTGCHRKEKLPPPDHTYTDRGVLVQLPDQQEGDLMIQHESIEHFIDQDGHETVMKSMVMPFTPAKDLSLEGLSPGDKVAFTFEVRWKSEPMLRVVKIHKLPAETKLKL